MAATVVSVGVRAFPNPAEVRSDALIEQVRGAEVTRFKGLGEISPKEFGQFIGEDMRAVKVNLRNLAEVPELLEFYMGRNTPERKDYIIDNLV